MRRLGIGAWAALFAVAGAAGQTAPGQATPKLEFEVASVKPSATSQGGLRGALMGGPGTGDPIRITGNGITLARLIGTAYDVPFDQISGPAWLQEEHYDIAAKVPAGATKDQVKPMWQSLLAERFGLAFHREPKEFPVYELTLAKGGAKLKTTAYPDAKPAKPGDYPVPAVLDADGYPAIPHGIAGMQSVPLNGVSHATFQARPISGFLFLIQSSLGSMTGPNTWAPARVIDKTGLTGLYDFKLEFAGGMGPGAAFQPQQSLGASAGPDGMLDIQDPGGGPDLFTALEKQLGLTLTKGKATYDVLVIDKASRVPTEN
jgi:uncharacterized protein (TIGR03435 family)